MAKVDFFIAGAQKGGTTALHRHLSRHPQLQMSSKKEVHFFDRNKTDWANPEYSQLHRFFDWTCHRVRGEATPIYSFWPQAMERLHAYNPSARIILLLRHPAFRAYSHWRMEVQRQEEALTFERAISSEGRRRLEEAEDARRRFSYLERGFYAWQIRRLLNLFPREAVLFLKTDDLWASPATAVRRVQDFLKVDDLLQPGQEYIVPVQSSHVGQMSTATRNLLGDLYRDDILKTASLAGMDLSDWLKPSYVEAVDQRSSSAATRDLNARTSAHSSATS